MTDSFRETVAAETNAAAERLSAEAARAEDAIDEGAGRVRAGLRRTRDGLEGASRKVGNAASDSIDYFRDSSVRGVMHDMEDVIKKHPGRSLLAVAAAGFVLGRALRRRD